MLNNSDINILLMSLRKFYNKSIGLTKDGRMMSTNEFYDIDDKLQKRAKELEKKLIMMYNSKYIRLMGE